jgi:hypothetical protein
MRKITLTLDRLYTGIAAAENRYGLAIVANLEMGPRQVNDLMADCGQFFAPPEYSPHGFQQVQVAGIPVEVLTEMDGVGFRDAFGNYYEIELGAT